jgi:hypothetical protein
VVDAGAKLSEIAVDAHAESFQLETSGPRILVNLPKSQKTVVVDRTKRKVIGAWKTGGAESNFPMALDETNHRLMVVCRSPARLLVFDTSTGLYRHYATRESGIPMMCFTIPPEADLCNRRRGWCLGL